MVIWPASTCGKNSRPMREQSQRANEQRQDNASTSTRCRKEKANTAS